MIKEFNNNGRITFLVIKWGKIVFKSPNKSECYEYVFDKM